MSKKGKSNREILRFFAKAGGVLYSFVKLGCYIEMGKFIKED